jgi:hypothetical protein
MWRRQFCGLLHIDLVVPTFAKSWPKSIFVVYDACHTGRGTIKIPFFLSLFPDFFHTNNFLAEMSRAYIGRRLLLLCPCHPSILLLRYGHPTSTSPIPIRLRHSRPRSASPPSPVEVYQLCNYHESAHVNGPKISCKFIQFWRYPLESRWPARIWGGGAG